MEVLGRVAMSLRYDEQQLGEQLSNLPPIAALTFALACAARLENTARNVGADEGLKRLLSRTLDAAIDCVKSELTFDTLAAEQALLDAMPDEDACGELPAAVAEDAASAAVYALRLIRDGDPQDGIWAARCAYDTADSAVLGTLDVREIGKSEEAYINQHPVVQTELQRQSRDLDSVARIGGEARADLSAVIELARRENILPYGR